MITCANSLSNQILTKMKTIKAILMVACFAMTTGLMATDNPSTYESNLRAELLDYVKSIDVESMDETISRVEVHFIVNSKQEIVVVSTSDSSFDETLKSRLNYKKIKTQGVEQNKLHILPILFKK